MKSRIRNLEKQIIPERPIPFIELLMPEPNEDQLRFEARVLKRRKVLIRKHGKAEFLKGCFLTLRPAAWKQN